MVDTWNGERAFLNDILAMLPEGCGDVEDNDYGQPTLYVDGDNNGMYFVVSATVTDDKHGAWVNVITADEKTSGIWDDSEEFLDASQVAHEIRDAMTRDYSAWIGSAK